MIRCKAQGGGVLVPVRAGPGASRNRIAGEHAGSLKVMVTAPPEGGRANGAIAATLARALGVRESAVELVSGRSSRDKVFHVEGVTPGQVNRLAGETSTSAAGR